MLLRRGLRISPIAAGLLLDAELPEIIWTIQLAAAALSALSLLSLAALRKRSAFGKDKEADRL